jgi:DNA-binding HxlR family transcriptional regulator
MPERTAFNNPKECYALPETPGQGTAGRCRPQDPARWPTVPGDSDEAWNDAATVLTLLDAKWALRILRALQDSPLRHNELMRTLATIHPAVLADTLRRMQAAGLIDRHVHPGPPPRVSYQLTSLGHSTLPLITLLSQWAVEHSAQLTCHHPGRSTGLDEARTPASEAEVTE